MNILAIIYIIISVVMLIRNLWILYMADRHEYLRLMKANRYKKIFTDVFTMAVLSFGWPLVILINIAMTISGKIKTHE